MSDWKTLNDSPSSDLHVISLHKQIHIEVVRQSWWFLETLQIIDDGKTSAIWLVEKNTMLAYFTLDISIKYKLEIRNLLIENKLMIID